MAPFVAGRRLAIVVSRTSDGKPGVFLNYRGVGRMEANSTYQATVSPDLGQNPLLWEAVRCSVSAPCFFQCKHLPGFGTLQDGGVRANNPYGIAQEECRIIWPSAQTHDLLLSVGTGYVPPVAEEHVRGPHPHDSLQDRAPLRLWRAYNASPCMDGAEAFREGLNHVPYSMRSRFFRLDHALAGDLPRLDDVARLTELAEISYTVPDELVRAILATCFFFELDEAPTRVCGRYCCRGSVLCARNQARSIVNRVLVEFPGAELRTNSGDCLGSVEVDDGCTACGYYRKGVRFSVASLDEDMSILFTGSSHQHPIGGFPATIQQFLDNQQADAVFGRSDHQTNQWPPRRGCYCPRGMKRVGVPEASPQRKRRQV